MPQCRKCSSPFLNHVVIDGKVRNLCRRKYCLDCSSFGSHNTRRLEGLARAIQEKTARLCRVCGRVVRKTVSDTRCNTCDTKVRRICMKMLAVEYLGGKCNSCGWVGSLVAFDFHHRDGDKVFAIADAAHHSWDKIRVELDKCELLCANCHRLKHYKGEADLLWLKSLIPERSNTARSRRARSSVDRVTVFETVSRRFKSCRAHKKKPLPAHCAGRGFVFV